MVGGAYPPAWLSRFALAPIKHAFAKQAKTEAAWC
jgi:hypothetical protein